MGFQVIISKGFDGEGFGVEKKALQSSLKIDIFAPKSGFEAVLTL